MKKWIAVMLCILMMLSGTLGSGHTINYAAAKEAKLYVDGREVYLEKKPVVEKGVLMVPAESILESLEADYYYDKDSKTMWGLRGIYIFDIKIGQLTAQTSSGKVIKLKVPPKVIGGTVYIPITLVSEGLGCTVKQDAAKNIYQIKRSKLSMVNDISKLYLKTVVKIETNRGFGTGVMMETDGTILTNAHVIKRAQWIKVTTTDHKTYDAKVLMEDKILDMAELKIQSKSKFPAVRYWLGFGDVSVGDQVVAIGHPLGYDNTVSAGTVSAIHQKFEEMNNLSIYQITAPISSGNSGGPLFNEHGELVGINTAMNIDGQNLNFAVPIEYYMDSMENNPNTYDVDIYELYDEYLYWTYADKEAYQNYDGLKAIIESKDYLKMAQVANKALPMWRTLLEEVSKIKCDNADGQEAANLFKAYIELAIKSDEALLKYSESKVPNDLEMARMYERDADQAYKTYLKKIVEIEDKY